MYFLETVEGTKGEKFTSAILRYLFINSDPTFRGFEVVVLELLWMMRICRARLRRLVVRGLGHLQ